LIFTRKITFNDSLNYIKERRPVANPNMAFIAQLICFYKRLFEEAYDSLPVSPRVFIIGSHEKEDADRVVPRLVNLYSFIYLLHLADGKFVLREQQ
jgi:hypothetical protein